MLKTTPDAISRDAASAGSPIARPSHVNRAHLDRRRAIQAAAAFAALPLIHPRHAAASADAVDQIRRDYDGYAASYDDLDGGAVAEALGFPDQRSALLSRASGDVLECAVGTGLNLQFYSGAALRSFTAIDISPGMLAQAQRKAEAALHLGSDALAFRTADVAALPFPDASFDCVVDTFSMCVFPDPGAALRSMARLLRPGGRALLLEHSRSPSPLLGWYQDVTTEQVATMGKGCVWNQDVLALVRAAGLRVERVDSYLGGLVLGVEGGAGGLKGVILKNVDNNSLNKICSSSSMLY